MADDGLINFRTVMVVPGEYITKYAYTASNQVEYLGYAKSGTADATASWTIRKFTYSSGLTTSELIAKNVAWDDREIVSYS